MHDSISLIVVDDEQLVGAAIANLCRSIDRVEVLNVAVTGWDGLALIENLRPTVAIVDLLMADLNGLDLTARVIQKRIPTRIIALTGSPDANLCARARQAGVTGYLLTVSLEEELNIAIRAAADGKQYVTPQMTECFWNRGTKLSHPCLSGRQREVLQLIVQDRTNKEIASILNIQVKTVEKHRAELKRRFGVSGTAGLVAHAIANRLIYLRSDNLKAS